MMENRRPSVVLKHYDFDSASDIEQFNSRNGDHKLYINMSPSKSSVSDESQLEKNFYLKKSSQKIIRNGESPLKDVPKRVSFSDRSRILYFNKDSDALYSEEIIDNVVHTSEQPFADPSSTESKNSEISSEDKQFHPMEKDLVIVLKKLPVNLLKQVEKENCDLGECVQSVTPLSDSQNFNESSDLQSNESQVCELTKSSENILSNDRQKLTSTTNSSSELNPSLHQKLNISIQRLPNHLLEIHLNNNSLKSFEENLNSSTEGESYNEDLSLTENKVSETEVNDLSLLQHPALDTDSDSLHSTPSKRLRQGSCQHENGVCNCDLAIRNSCVLIERLSGDVFSSHCTQNESLKQVSCQHKISVYNSGIPTNTCVPNETSNGDVNLLHSNEPLKQEPCEYESNVSNSDVSSRSPIALNEALNGQANSLYSISTNQLKEEPCEHKSNVNSFDVSVRNPCVPNEALNADAISLYSTRSEPLNQESCDGENNVHNSDVSTNNPTVPNEALNRDVNSSCLAQSEPIKQESCDVENNVHNSDVSTNNPSVPNEALNKDVNSSCPVPREPINQESCNKNNIFNCDISIRNPCVLLERLELIVPNVDSIQSTEKFQKRKVNDKDILYNEQDDINGNLVETESNIVLGSADKHLTGSSKLSKTSKGKKRPTIKSGSAGNNPKRLSNAVKAFKKKKSKSQLEVRNETSISLNNIHLPSHKVAEIIPVNSHDLSCATNVLKQCSLKLTKTKHLPKSQINYKHTEPSLSKYPLKQKSYQYKSSTSSSEDEIPLANWSKQSSYLKTPTGDSDKQLLEKYSSTENHSSISDNSSSEDDIALSLLSKPGDIERTNYLCNQEKNTLPFSYLENSSNINQTSGISNLNVSEMSTSTGNQYHIPNFTSSEDDMPFSLVHKLSNINPIKIDGRVKKKKKLQESKTVEMQRFTDLNVMHMVEVTPPNSLTFMSNAIKKVKKTSAAKKIQRKKLSKEGILLFSRVNDMNNSKQMKISGHSERKIEKMQKSKTSKMQKFTDANVMHVAEMKTPNSLSFISDFKKKAKKFRSTKQVEREKLLNKDMPSFLCLNDMDNIKQSSGNKKKKKQLRFKSDFKKKGKKIERNIPSKEELLSFSSSSEIDSLEIFAQGKKCYLKKPLESGAKKRKSEPVLPPKQTKLNCINESTLISQYNKASNCKNNSALHLKSISDNCYYETVESDNDCDILPPLKKKKLDNYKLSCNMYEANKKKSVVDPIKNGTVTKKSKKKEDCQSKNKRISNELHTSLRNYLNRFFTEFDSLGVSKKKELSFSQQETKMVKKRERIYRMLISEMFHHLKNTCSIKKSYKSQRLKEKLSKRSSGQLSPRKLELKDDFPSISAQTKGNSQKREGNKENHTDKFQLGFLTGDNYLKLYNRCVAAERLILSKYKMKKQQRRKIKRFFKTLKKNSLKRN